MHDCVEIYGPKAEHVHFYFFTFSFDVFIILYMGKMHAV